MFRDKDAEAPEATGGKNKGGYPDIPDGFLSINDTAEHFNMSQMNVRRVVKLDPPRIEGARKIQHSGKMPDQWIIPIVGFQAYLDTKGRSSSGGMAFVIKFPEASLTVVTAGLAELAEELEITITEPTPRYKKKVKVEA